MARKAEYRNPRTFSVTVEAEIKDEIDQFRGRLSYGKVFTLLWQAHKGEVVNAIELENLRRENVELKARVEELTRLVQKLQEQLEKTGRVSAREREAKDLHKEIHQILSTYNELKLLELLRHLGYSETGDALKKKAEAFLKRWFVLEGKVFVSKELGVALEPSEHVGMLGWKVRKLEVKA
ncbi:hypothetical protein [Thermococcus piezophilus]|uniref:Uncharacterized protein n=1 Tax=Thermococcus piezophilus TaxID=1712654 RepID=A0A172WFC4_9EURY|nr:hypothetical protein [Thermococcus piezophilus]ANF22069.1 hypothetical protein A7C91_01835 [Thermococcus piezophilus]